jgi:PEP-CTERM motif
MAYEIRPVPIGPAWTRFSYVAGVVVACLLAIFSSTESHAIQVNIDQFTITRNGSTFFSDSFTDGSEPPSAPTGSYNVFGSFGSNAESGGKLLLDTATGALSANAIETPRRTVAALFLSNSDSSNLTAGLKIDDTLSVTGIFDLVIPTGPLFSAYGVRFSDASGGATHQFLQMSVRFDPVTSQPQILYVLQDFDANTITNFGTVPFAPPSGTDQTLLSITRPDETKNEFFGSWAFLDDGTTIGSGSFLTPGSAFLGENFVRGQFFASQGVQVPEPDSLWLIGFGLILLLANRFF